MGGHYFLFHHSNSIERLPELYQNSEVLKRVATNISSAVTQNLVNYQWDQAYYQKNDTDPKRIGIFKLTVEPNEFWISKGVKKPFHIYNAILAYSDMEKCIKDMIYHLKQDKAHVIKWDNNEIDLGKQSQIMGYIGHNVYYGGTYEIDDLESLPYTAQNKKGLFFFGCQSSKWCTSKFESALVANLLFCKTNMASEGYIMLGLLDGLSRGLKGEELVKLCNRVYGIAQGQGPNIRLFTNGNLIITQSAPTIPSLALMPAPPSTTPAQEKLRREYSTTKKEVKAKQDEFRARYEAAGSDEKISEIIVIFWNFDSFTGGGFQKI